LSNAPKATGGTWLLASVLAESQLELLSAAHDGFWSRHPDMVYGSGPI
jgi:hypothetical protein